MTVDNCIKLLKEYEAKGQKKFYENMKEHILHSRKFKGHPIVAELQKTPKKKEEKSNEKPKGRAK